MKEEQLNKILERHEQWLQGKKDGIRANLSNENLRFANLEGANLSWANLKGADIRGANLKKACLNYANLNGAILAKANLSDASIISAGLKEASLEFTDFRGANLNDALLSNANLSNADLSYAFLNGADFENACLRGADLSKSDLFDANFYRADFEDVCLKDADTDNTNLEFALNIIHPMTCPISGSFIGYKKAEGKIVELEILSESRRSSSTGRKCRCDRAKVLSITEPDGSECSLKSVTSSFTESFIYTVGETVLEPNFDDCRWNECASGIHFFMSRDEAVEY